MANPEQLEIIKRGPAAWNEWRRQHSKEWIDLSRATLSDFRSRSGQWIGDLSGINLRGANLARVNLIRANLTGADLTETDLIGADLTEANLTRAYLIGADLSGAHLLGANLREANLTRTYLVGTNLRDARLHHTNFTKAICTHTIFTQVTFGQSIFGDVDLSSAIGLQTARHDGSSVIGIDTLYRSRGKIPEVFLRGVGVPEDFIVYIPSLTAEPLQFYSCFISYSHNDRAFARRLHDSLQGRGIRCWLDEKQLLPGHDIYDEIDRGIRLWDKVLLCCSESSLRSWWVDQEINGVFAKEQQLQREQRRKVLALIPLDLDGYLLRGWNGGKAEIVKARLAADFKGWASDNTKFEEQFERVVKALQTDEGREAPPPPRL